ncbi:hypothetical protein [Mycobacteroides abscessus]|uniref:hypothetical protein n=1 Tax=Mycobacteroides abscessus TaxID=36809 RepID=UPI00092CAD96|nr:hypothetical protein [Mycobacteroides abscessus]SHX64728.1 Uncharacterised protein [Mycobacteroides abscessus subsp. abscessus]SHZ18228.1 Uncharacterised protein [Mycobacteroides abscessus subsp. abscessus]SIB50954.1 Uncharacterised protein [Mycobacteroides abscessus subsp. abscessus]SIF18692.1 Uncharacterised protein [Mycobacteroides abscessus subsp. abscessus]SKI48325.1 Uncharacterised protein [Mycobacteroides abscessus subsp. abscessus]
METTPRAILFGVAALTAVVAAWIDRPGIVTLAVLVIVITQAWDIITWHVMNVIDLGRAHDARAAGYDEPASIAPPPPAQETHAAPPVAPSGPDPYSAFDAGLRAD